VESGTWTWLTCMQVLSWILILSHFLQDSIKVTHPKIDFTKLIHLAVVLLDSR